MLNEDEQIAIARHDGRCLACDRGGEDGIVVSVPRDTFDIRRIYDLGKQVDLGADRPRERGIVTKSSDEDFLELVHQNGAGDERELTAKDPR